MPRLPEIARLREKIARLSTTASQDELAATAGLLAEHVASRPQPDMAIGALFRHNAPAGLSEEVKERVRGEALAILARSAEARRQVGAAEQDLEGGWLLVHEAAPRLRLQERTLLERLKRWQHRQRLGWPRWDGHRWLIPAPAVDSARAVQFLTTAPEREPLPHLLPDWCERQP